MKTLDLINIDSFKQNYYKALLPLEEINAFLGQFEERELEAATQSLISLFDVAITKTVLLNLDSVPEKQEFLRLAQDDYTSPAVLDFLIDTFPGSEELIKQALERTLLSAKKAIL
ncbi:MAG: hypothetical protein BroJett025_05400 [Patescibacteria group bacterium]|nr:MAG: hypothetical protein BroJett025_05400 [Patescibacteria group bacterium]